MVIPQTVQKISPNELLGAVLVELDGRGKRCFQYDMIGWHKAFNEAKNEFSDLMKSFHVIKRVNPYVHALETAIRMHELTGHLTSIEMTNEYLINNPKELEATFGPRAEVQEVAKYICDRI